MTEEQKQRVVSTWIKLTRYKARTEQFPECFGQTEQICLKDLEKENRSNDIKPGSRDCVTFWSGIWVELVSQNNKTQQWLKKELVSDTSKKAKKKTRKHHYTHWKFENNNNNNNNNNSYEGPDRLQGYWINTFTFWHENQNHWDTRLDHHRQNCTYCIYYERQRELEWSHQL